jgi:hypothetical protein
MPEDTSRRNKWVGVPGSVFPGASSEATTSDSAQSTRQSFSDESLNDSHHFVGGTHQQSQVKLPGYWTHQRRQVLDHHIHLTLHNVDYCNSHQLREQAKANRPDHARTKDEESKGKGKAKDDTKSVSTFRSWLRRQS